MMHISFLEMYFDSHCQYIIYRNFINKYVRFIFLTPCTWSYYWLDSTISYTSIQCMDFIEMFNVSLDLSTI